MCDRNVEGLAERQKLGPDVEANDLVTLSEGVLHRNHSFLHRAFCTCQSNTLRIMSSSLKRCSGPLERIAATFRSSDSVQ